MPDLWLTVSRYLASLKAVLAPTATRAELAQQIGCQLTRAEIEANWSQFERTEELVKQFMLNEGPELQRDLKEYANKCQNWVSSSGCHSRSCFHYVGQLISLDSTSESDFRPAGVDLLALGLMGGGRPIQRAGRKLRAGAQSTSRVIARDDDAGHFTE